MLVHLYGEAASGKGASFQKARLDQIFHRNTKRFRNPVNHLGRAFFKLRSAAAQIVYGGVGNTAVLGQSVFCDLLIIDDLGTELTNSFVASQFFLCINERILRKKSTVISTNLTLGSFMDTYSERVFSRVSSNYTMIKLIGKDIRIQKKILGGN